MSRSPISSPFGATVFLATPPPKAPLDRAAVGHLDADPDESLPSTDTVAALVALKPVFVLTSDLRQDSFVAMRIADACGVPLAFDPALRDRSYGAWEGRTWTDLVTAETSAADFLAHFDTARPPGGETLDDVATRARRPISDFLIKRHRQTLLVVVTPTVVRAVLAAALELPQATACRFRIDPHSTTGIRSEGTFSTLSWMNRGGSSFF